MKPLSRRRMLQKGGAISAALLLRPRILLAGNVIEIAMGGEAGAHVWFNPIGILIEPGQTLRWTNHDQSNAHTATAYHPDVGGRVRRIPVGAEPWDSGYLMPGEMFSVTLEHAGIYDYYCVPHERAGMVGRIIVGQSPADDWLADATASDGLPAAALAAFPDFEAILKHGRVMMDER